jgi:hypothetical protein
MKKACIVYGLVLLSINSFTYAQKTISFFEEHIDFTLDSAYFSINGIYSFYNPTDKAVNQRILFPFAEETEKIDSINVTDLNNLNKISFRCLDKAIAFFISLTPYDTVDIHIFYRKKVAAKNSYILTSTQTWKRPLEKAVYTLTSSLPINEKQFSYPFLSKEIINDNYCYFWEMTNFLPDKEFEVFIQSPVF